MHAISGKILDLIQHQTENKLNTFSDKMILNYRKMRDQLIM